MSDQLSSSAGSSDCNPSSPTEGGERCIDVIEVIAIVRALGCEPVEVFKALVRSTEESRPARRRG